jgi:hypothetical protein
MIAKDICNTVACVNDASGRVGRKIVDRLLTNGYTVRVLSRKDHSDDPGAQLFTGGLEDGETLRSFLLDLQLDNRGLPMYGNSLVGLDGCYRLRHSCSD